MSVLRREVESPTPGPAHRLVRAAIIGALSGLFAACMVIGVHQVVYASGHGPEMSRESLHAVPMYETRTIEYTAPTACEPRWAD